MTTSTVIIVLEPQSYRMRAKLYLYVDTYVIVTEKLQFFYYVLLGVLQGRLKLSYFNWMGPQILRTERSRFAGSAIYMLSVEWTLSC